MNTTESIKPKLEHVDIWRATYKGIAIEITNHMKGHDVMGRGHGVWCFYLYIRDTQTTRFSELWLEDKEVKYTESSPVRIVHEYMNSLIAQPNWHGGITFYQKMGIDKEGFRVIKVGCDYNHLWDEEYHGSYNEEWLLGDAMAVCDELIDLLQIKIS